MMELPRALGYCCLWRYIQGPKSINYELFSQFLGMQVALYAEIMGTILVIEIAFTK